MKFKLPANALPVLELSAEAREELLAEGQQIIDETQRAADAFALGGKHVSKQQWKLLKRKENLRVYRDRRRARKQQHGAGHRGGNSSSSSGHRHSGGSNHSGGVDYDAGAGFTPALPELDPVITSQNQYEYFYSPHDASEASSSIGEKDEDGETETPTLYSSTSSDALLQALKPSELPVVMAEGTVDGSLEDFMLGALNGDESKTGERRLEASYLRGKFDDARALAILQAPTAESPLSFASIKWLLKDQPAVLNSVASRRDHIVLEMAGSSTDAQGRPVGYHLFHSVFVPGLRELPMLGLIRGYVSFCFIVRPTSPTSLDVYCRGYTDARGGLLPTIATMVAADCVLAVASIMDCSIAMKLAWLTERNLAQPKPLMRSTSRGSGGSSSEPLTCASCGRPSSKFAMISSSEATACRVCNEVRSCK